MSGNTNTDTDELAQQIADTIAPIIEEYVDEQVPDPGETIDLDALADKVASRIEIDHPDRLSEQQVIDLINEHAGGDAGDGNGSDGLTDELRRDLERVCSPDHTAVIETGSPSEDYHPHGDWGPIVTVHEPVHWRSAVIDAESQGRTRLQIYTMDYSDGETYEVGDVHATREIRHGAGEQYIYPEVTLPEGQYFLTRDPDLVEPMRRVQTDVDWGALNDGHNAPVTVECSWRANANYQPGTDAFQNYRDNGWTDILHYFADMSFGFDDTEG